MSLYPNSSSIIWGFEWVLKGKKLAQEFLRQWSKGDRFKEHQKCSGFVLIFTACCTAIHMFLCMSNIITSFQKDGQHNEWIVKHAHKNSRVCLEVGAICSQFTEFPGLCFYISCAFFIKKKHLMGMQLILIFFFFFLPRWLKKKASMCGREGAFYSPDRTTLSEP